MNLEGKDEEHLRNYLLGELNEADQQALEERLLVDEELIDLLLAEEDELVDDYLGGELSERERERFDSYFLPTPERRRKLRFGDALRRYEERVVENSEDPRQDPATKESGPNKPAAKNPGAKEAGAKLPPTVLQPPSPVVIGPSTWWSQAFSTPYLRLAAAAVIVFALGLGIWRIWPSSPGPQVSNGMLALREAYPDERPTEARITEWNYAPPRQITRDDEEGKFDYAERDRAEGLIHNEVKVHADAKSYHDLGRLYLAKHEYDKAKDQLLKALELDGENAQLHSDLGVALFERGKVESAKGRRMELFASALEQFGRAIDLNSSLLEAIFNQGLCHTEIGLKEQAKEDWLRYIALDSSSSWANEARSRLEELQKASQRRSQDREQLHQDFLSAHAERNDSNAWQALRQGRARGGNFITERLLDLYLDRAALGQNDEADNYLQMVSYAGELEYERANDRFTKDQVRFYRTASPKQRQALAAARQLMKSAGEHQTNNEYEEAARQYSEANNAFEQVGDSCEAALAKILVATSKLRIEAKESLRILQPLAESLKSGEYRHLLAQALNGIADAQSTQRNISESLAASKQASEVSEQIEDFNGILRSWQIPVAMYIRIGEYHRSLEWASRAFDFAGSFSPDPLEMWTFYHQTAIDLYSLDLSRAALEFQQEALRVAIESGRPLYKSRSYARLGIIYEKLQNHDEAIKNAQLALAEAPNVKGPKIRANIVANAALHLADLYRQNGDLQQAVIHYDQAIRIHNDLNIEGYIFGAHKGKLMALMKMNDLPAIEDALKEAMPLIEQYRPKILEESSRNRFFDLAQDIYDIAIDFSHSRIKDDTQAFNYVEASHGRSLLDLMKSNERMVTVDNNPELKLPRVSSPLTLAKLEQRLPGNTKILQYCVLDQKILMWVVSKRPLETREGEITSDALEQKVRRYVELIRSDAVSMQQEREDLARELYEILIAPVEQLLKGTDYLCIVPDKVLNYLPFGALVSRDSGNYFIEDHVFVFAPSCSIFAACTDFARRKAGHKDERFLGVGNPDFDRTKFSNLASAETEASLIAHLYNRPVPVLLTGDDAREGVIKEQMKRADVVHIASHYVIDESPMASRLVLAKEQQASGNQSEDGFLKASEIYDMRLPRTRLVVLSACQTGIERSYRGEGAISAARPFIKALVPLVVGSLWRVDSGPTRDLMIAFHKHRKQGAGTPTAKALCLAQRDMLKSSDKRNNQPSTWASFVAIGGYTTF